ncbi:Cell division control protein 48B [Abeliophyllum distichum]|uniref:Cell division control protein 48B n=1 Tax=Abeliophyllum distichum TaxID=126358 RepID=A0ABD1U2P7_9LAMI
MKSGSGRIVQGGGGAAKQRAEKLIAGNAEALKALREFINFNLLLSRKAQILGLKRWPSNLLLYGPSGTGKTSLVRAVVQESGAHLVTVRSYAKDIEKTLREAFAQASSHAKSAKPSVIFIDEIDVLCSRQNSRREQDTRVVSLLGVLMDSHKSSPTSTSHFVVVASTHRVDAIDPALRRPGRFDSEIEVRIPNVDERFQILKLYTKKLHLNSEVDLQTVAVSCNGYVGADLLGLCRMATYSAENRSSDVNQVDALCTITMDDWKHAMSVVKPSITRGVTEKIPEVSWDDIGGLKDLKKKLQQAVEWPLKYSSSYSRLGISPPRGILLHGPPGCSKTTLAKAIAHVTQASFFSLSPADLYNKYVGEGEAMLRDTFRRARLASPSIIFFDDADAIGAKRGGSSSGNSRVGDKILSTLLTEMDGLEESKGVLVLAATNLLDAIDPALKRPGRFDEVLYVPLPDSEGRHEILQIHIRKLNTKLDDEVDLRQIAEDTEGFSGADLANLCKRVGMIALGEDMSTTAVCIRHFQTAIRSVKEPPTIIIRSVKAARTKQKSKGTKKLLFPAIPAIALIIYAGIRYISTPTSSITLELART